MERTQKEVLVNELQEIFNSTSAGVLVDYRGLAANEMAKDPEAAKSGQFIPKSKKIIVHSRMLKQGEKETLRFKAPRKPGRYPYLCSFPGHWALMRGKIKII